MQADIVVIGGGLAGCEAAWQAARAGARVSLFEMRPVRTTAAHSTDGLAELVCSNSLGSALPDRGLGLLKNELRQLGSLLIGCADATAVPAGAALAVDREAFSRAVTEAVTTHPAITVHRQRMWYGGQRVSQKASSTGFRTPSSGPQIGQVRSSSTTLIS